MSVLLADPWQAMPLGPGTPVGWTDVFTSTRDVRSFADNGAFFPHQWYQLATNQQQSPRFTANAIVDATVWFAWSPINSGALISLAGTSNLGAQFIVTSIQQENDGTLSVYVAGLTSPIANTGAFNRSYSSVNIPSGRIGENWYYVQWNVSISTTGIGGINFLTVKTDLAVDGEVVFSGESGISNFFTDASFTHLGVNQLYLRNVSGFGELYVVDRIAAPAYPQGVWTVALTNPGNGNYLSGSTTVTVTDVGLGFGAVVIPVIPVSPGPITNLLIVNGGLDYTGPALTITDSSGSGSGATGTAAIAPAPYRRIYQGVVETILNPTTSHAQIYQSIIELIKKPSTSNVQIYQAVIELITQREAVPGGWNVSES